MITLSLICIALMIYGIIYSIRESRLKRPLTDKEIIDFANVKRTYLIYKTFDFTHIQFNVNPKYRESLDSRGRWDRASLKLTETLSCFTDLLKYKRHEWFLWGLADEKECKFIWANKGYDNESCYFSGSFSGLVALAKENKCHTVISMHNHPHTKERYWNLLKPSQTDINTYNKLKSFFESKGLNYIDALCTQGSFMIYGFSICDDYLPAEQIADEIRERNNKSKLINKVLRIQYNEAKKFVKSYTAR